MSKAARRIFSGFKIEGEPCVVLELTQGQWMIFEEADRDVMMSCGWYAAKNRSGKYYAMSTGLKPKQYAHRYLLQAVPRMQTDHRNGNTLDMRRKNLRVARWIDNNRNVGKTVRNTSGLKGVSRDGRRFRAQIRDGEKNITLGRRDTAKEAHELYATAARKRHGEFSNLG